jgi:integrase
VRELFQQLHGTARLMAGLLYGSGLRLMECVRLRVKDVDFGYARITVRDAEGGKDQVTMGCGEECGSRGWPDKTSDVSHPVTFVCEALARAWLRHPNCARASRPQRRQHDHAYTHVLNKPGIGVRSWLD